VHGREAGPSSTPKPETAQKFLGRSRQNLYSVEV
jgi:hypothetical protein